jgi:hypothetical protein
VAETEGGGMNDTEYFNTQIAPLFTGSNESLTIETLKQNIATLKEENLNLYESSTKTIHIQEVRIKELTARAEQGEKDADFFRISLTARIKELEAPTSKCLENANGECGLLVFYKQRIKELEGEVLYWKQQFEGRGVC